MARQENYFLYHNPDTMGKEFAEIAQSGQIATYKELAATQAVEAKAVIWCVGRKSGTRRYFFYQRIVADELFYSKPAEVAQGGFKFTVKGKPHFIRGYEKEITEETYFIELKKILGFGLQKLGTKAQPALNDFIAEYERTKL